MNIGVLGGGALGLGAALRLAQAGHRVDVVEREPTVGGLAAGFRVGPSWLEKFYHHLFRNDHCIVQLIEELGLGDRLEWFAPDTSVLLDGTVWSLDSAPDVLRFGPLPPLSRVRLGAGLAFLKVLQHERPLENQTAAQWIKRWMGNPTYQRLWGPLLRAKFHDAAEEISMAWFWARVHYRTPQLGYLRGGFQQLYDGLKTAIERLGGQVKLGEAAISVESIPAGPVRVRTEQGLYEYDRLLVTLPTRLFLRLAQGLPQEYVDRYSTSGEHLSAHCTILALQRPLTSAYWLNVNDPGFPFLALVEHTNMVPPEDYDGLRIVYLGNYLPPDHGLFSKPAEAILSELLPALARINPSFDPTWVVDSWHYQAPFAQPVVRKGYPATLAPHKTPLANVYLANMGHVYPQDRGQNFSLLLGERMAKMVG